MKGRYTGCPMNVYSTIPGYKYLASIPKLSKKARQRLKWFEYYYSHSQNARLTYRHFDISPQTFYRWKKRYDPKHLRQPTYLVELVETVLRLREEYPRWDKDKLVILLRREGFDCSASTVGRILHKLRERGVLREPMLNHILAVKRNRRSGFS